MASIEAATASDDAAFVHEVAISLSNELNTDHPNDLLAKRVVDIVRHNAQDQAAFAKAAASFGLSRPAYLAEVFELVKNKEGVRFGIFVGHRDDVMQPAAAIAGGLARPGLATSGGGDKHVFKAPPTPIRSSVLGLDRLAQDKRRERADNEAREAKRPRLDDGRAEFKGEQALALSTRFLTPLHSSHPTGQHGQPPPAS
jgi:pre-mRNA-splicing factor ATP-dependent RNA helicase DHX38/PRP16